MNAITGSFANQNIYMKDTAVEEKPSSRPAIIGMLATLGLIGGSILIAFVAVKGLFWALGF